MVLVRDLGEGRFWGVRQEEKKHRDGDSPTAYSGTIWFAGGACSVQFFRRCALDKAVASTSCILLRWPPARYQTGHDNNPHESSSQHTRT